MIVWKQHMTSRFKEMSGSKSTFKRGEIEIAKPLVLLVSRELRTTVTSFFAEVVETEPIRVYKCIL